MIFNRLLLICLICTPLCLISGCSGLVAGPGPIDPDAPEEYTTTESGLQYRILRKSDRKKPNAGGNVRVHYEGRLEDGSVFDSSYTRGKPSIFRLDQVVPGWGEGMQLVGEGGMIELVIPPQLGYGAAGSPPSVPPNAKLTFIVELIRVF